jgi:tetratricopeptide (TPR) repeat protein
MRLIIVLISLSLFLGCAGNKKSSNANPATVTGTLAIHVPPVSESDSLLQPKGAPDRNVAHESFLRGIYMRNTGNKEIAEHFYKRALANEPGNRFLAFELVEILTNNNKAKDALEIAQKAIRFPGKAADGEYYQLARLYRSFGNIDSAKAYYEKTIELSPTHFRALYEYSVVLEMLQDYKNLVRVYDLLLPQLNYPRPMVDKQLLLLKLKGGDSATLEFLQKAYEVRGDAEIGREYADALLAQKKPQEAVEVAKALVEGDPADRESAKYLVSVGLKSGFQDSVVAWQKRVVVLDTADLEELERLALLEFELSSLDSSQSHFKALLDRRPGDHLAWFYTSALAMARPDSAKAFDAIARAIALKPDALAYRNQLAAIYSHYGEFAQAHKVLDSALALFKDHPLAMQFKASTYIREASLIGSKYPQAGSPEATKIRNLRQQALQWLLKASKVDSLSTDILFDLAANYEQLDSVSQSRKVFQSLLQMEPLNHQALNYLGYMLVERKIDVDLGGRLIDSALVQNPANFAYLDSKAWFLACKGQWLQAKEILLFLVEKGQTSDPVIWEHLAESCDGAEDFPMALSAWRKVLGFIPHHAKALQRQKELLATKTIPSKNSIFK